MVNTPPDQDEETPDGKPVEEVLLPVALVVV
jgi:hypothetical protein